MRSGHKGQLDRRQVDALLESARTHLDAVLDCVEVTGGTFNTVYRLRLADGTGAVLKIAPDPTMPILSYEKDVLRTEARFYQNVAGSWPGSMSGCCVAVVPDQPAGFSVVAAPAAGGAATRQAACAFRASGKAGSTAMSSSRRSPVGSVTPRSHWLTEDCLTSS